jgi:UDP-glucuronate decarboxylase
MNQIKKIMRKKMEIKNKRILITGGAGFLGRHLCQRLLKKNYVICVDNFYTGSRRNVQEFVDLENFSLVEHDIIKPLYFDSLDYILNFACPASPVHYQKDPIFTTKTSVLGTINMLDLAKKTGACLIHASTSEVYGDPIEHPQKEEYVGAVNPVGIRACYDEGKRCAESLIFDYHRLYKLKVKVIRIFNTYGPYMDVNDGRVVSNFIVQALRNEPMTIYGDGTRTRSFCYVDDLIDGIIKMMETSKDVIGPINLGNNCEYKLIDLACKIKKLTNSSSPVVFLDSLKDDPKQRCPDLTKANDELGWQPVVTIDDGLIKTIYYFKKICLKKRISAGIF